MVLEIDNSCRVCVLPISRIKNEPFPKVRKKSAYGIFRKVPWKFLCCFYENHALKLLKPVTQQ